MLLDAYSWHFVITWTQLAISSLGSFLLYIAKKGSNLNFVIQIIYFPSILGLPESHAWNGVGAESNLPDLIGIAKFGLCCLQS